MTRALRRLLLLLMIVLLSLHGSFVRAADEDRETAKPAPALPLDKNLWLNTSPLTWEQLRGKGVVLLFFSCDTEGTEVFPKYLESAKVHALDPVVYIGISMGADRFNTEQFLKTTKYTWPTLCDPTYTYTRHCDTCVGSKPGDTIAESVGYSLYVTADGKMVDGWWDDPKLTVHEALIDAKWKTNPKEIPESLWPLWRAVEFRKYSEALPLFKKPLKSGSDVQKDAAKKLQEVVLAEVERLATEAKAADEMDQKWAAYSKLSRILDEFRGYDLPKDLEPLQKKLARSSQVKAGITAEKQLVIASGNLASPMPAIRKKALLQLEKIVSDFPGTELAEKAQKLIDTPQAAPK